MVKDRILSKTAFISFRGRMLKSKNLKIGSRSKAEFTLTVRTASVCIAKAVEMLRSGTLYRLSVMEKTSVYYTYGTGINKVLWKIV